MLSEASKYRLVWADPSYRVKCHSLDLWNLLRGESTPKNPIDLGCGTGRLVKAWREEGIEGVGIDIAPNAPDPDLPEDWFTISPLQSLTGCYDLGVCADVLEHIPPEEVDVVVERICACCDELWMKIAYFNSQLRGLDLHLTMKPSEWWVKIFEQWGKVEQVPFETHKKEFILRWRQ